MQYANPNMPQRIFDQEAEGYETQVAYDERFDTAMDNATDAARATNTTQVASLQADNLANLARQQRPAAKSTATAASTQVPYYTPSGEDVSGIANLLSKQTDLVSEASRRLPVGMTPAQRGVTGALQNAPNDMVAQLLNMGIFTPETAAQFYQSRYPGLTAEQVQEALAQYAPPISTGQMGPQQQTLTVNGMAQGGIASVAPQGQGYYLGGSTDGMADQIPATIDNRQPAALSDGEFVIPADVVSHLGNGNSNSGAEQLYGMMDRIRKARTGSAEQGKQINPNKFLA
ncbi:hypothetical protein N9909_00165 [bacterium]|nr:hypothetical protein [bacterium]